MKIVGIVQARMGSARRSGKVLAKICGKPMLEHLLTRLNASEKLHGVIVATTFESNDDTLVQWCIANDVEVFRGSGDNVLSRFYHCALTYDADVIVRITADDPLKDPRVIDYAVNTLINNEDLDYVSNTIDVSYPEGIDVEVFRFSALERAYKGAVKQSDLEHVTPYIWSNPDSFNLLNFCAKEDNSDIRLTVDYEVDLQVVEAILYNFKDNPLVSYQDIVAFLRGSANIASINSGILRNEGYAKSIIDKDENER